jgi:hypothetical protein
MAKSGQNLFADFRKRDEIWCVRDACCEFADADRVPIAGGFRHRLPSHHTFPGIRNLILTSGMVQILGLGFE